MFTPKTPKAQISKDFNMPKQQKDLRFIKQMRGPLVLSHLTQMHR